MGAIGRNITFSFAGVFLGVHHHRGRGGLKCVAARIGILRVGDKTPVSKSSLNKWDVMGDYPL